MFNLFSYSHSLSVTNKLKWKILMLLFIIIWVSPSVCSRPKTSRSTLYCIFFFSRNKDIVSCRHNKNEISPKACSSGQPRAEQCFVENLFNELRSSNSIHQLTKSASKSLVTCTIQIYNKITKILRSRVTNKHWLSSPFLALSRTQTFRRGNQNTIVAGKYIQLVVRSMVLFFVSMHQLALYVMMECNIL